MTNHLTGKRKITWPEGKENMFGNIPGIAGGVAPVIWPAKTDELDSRIEHELSSYSSTIM